MTVTVPTRPAASLLSVPVLSVVVPVYNEMEVLGLLHRELAAVMTSIGEPWEVVYVNDGSTDRTLRILEELHAADPHVALVNLSRNFGKEVATTAGLEHALGEAVVVIDADLQDPPGVIPELVAAWRGGADMVYAQRRTRAGESYLKRTTASLFYRLMRQIGRVELPPNVGDFRLMSRRVVEALGRMPEHHRFMKGLFAWVGFPSVAVPYDRAPRAAGITKWNYWRLWNLAVEGITSFTVVPLRVATYMGLLLGLVSMVYLAVLVVKTLLFGNQVAGYPSLMGMMLFLGSAQLITLGVIGEYLGRVFNETKRRPLYFIERYRPGTAAPETATTAYASARSTTSGT